MATTADLVRVGVTGGVYTAPSGTTIPTTVEGALDGAFAEVGYISEDGVTQSIGADNTSIKAWQNGDEVRVIQTSHSLTYAFTMIETSEVTLEAYYGNYTAGTVEISGDQLPRGPWVISVVDGDAAIRIVIPDGQVTERGDITYQNADAVGYPITISAFPDGSGNKAYMYLDADAQGS
jgi:hypothetical protein